MKTAILVRGSFLIIPNIIINCSTSKTTATSPSMWGRCSTEALQLQDQASFKHLCWRLEDNVQHWPQVRHEGVKNRPKRQKWSKSKLRSGFAAHLCRRIHSSYRVTVCFLDALASLEFKLSVSDLPFLQLAHLRVFQIILIDKMSATFQKCVLPKKSFA